MKKDAYWFSHDSNAKDDPKCMILIDQLGLEGYGIYWVLIETLRDQSEYRYPLKLLPILAKRYSTSAEKMMAVVQNYNMFEIEDGEFFFSNSLRERMFCMDEKRINARKAGIISGEKRRQLALEKGMTDEQSFNDGSTTAELSKVNNNKEKNKKEKKGDFFNEKDFSPEEKIKKVIIPKEINYPFPTKEFKYAWRDWKKYKLEEHKFKYKTEMSENKALIELKNLSKNNQQTAIKIIDQSISNGWKGFFQLKENENLTNKFKPKFIKDPDSGRYDLRDDGYYYHCRTGERYIP